MKYQVGNRVWFISQCYPCKPHPKLIGTPYRGIITEIESKFRITLSSNMGRQMVTLYEDIIDENVFDLVTRKYGEWKMNNPVDKTTPGAM